MRLSDPSDILRAERMSTQPSQPSGPRQATRPRASPPRWASWARVAPRGLASKESRWNGL
eukprot:712869-Alexandrium_andersonii.AAC.1